MHRRQCAFGTIKKTQGVGSAFFDCPPIILSEAKDLSSIAGNGKLDSAIEHVLITDYCSLINNYQTNHHPPFGHLLPKEGKERGMLRLMAPFFLRKACGFVY